MARRNIQRRELRRETLAFHIASVAIDEGSNQKRIRAVLKGVAIGRVVADQAKRFPGNRGIKDSEARANACFPGLRR